MAVVAMPTAAAAPAAVIVTAIKRALGAAVAVGAAERDVGLASMWAAAAIALVAEAAAVVVTGDVIAESMPVAGL